VRREKEGMFREKKSRLREKKFEASQEEIDDAMLEREETARMNLCLFKTF